MFLKEHNLIYIELWFINTITIYSHGFTNFYFILISLDANLKSFFQQDVSIMIFTCEVNVVAPRKILVPITPSAMPIKYWPIYALLKMSFRANITFYNCNRIQKILYDVYDIGSLFWHDCKIVDWN